MNYPTTAGTEGIFCVVISCSVLVTQAAIMYHVESEFEFQSHDYFLLLLPFTSSPHANCHLLLELLELTNLLAYLTLIYV